VIAMRFGVFTIGDRYSGASPDTGESAVEDAVELAVAAEAAGFDHFWVAEHHFLSSGSLPSPPVVLSAVASRTTRLRLGPLVAVLPLHEPIGLAEEYACVDRLSAGRLELAVGSGYMNREFRGFGLDPTARSLELDRRLPIVLAAWGGAETRSMATALPVRLNVRPAQRPYPPVWVAAGRPEAIRSIGRRGLGVALIPYATLDRLEALRPVVEAYTAALPAGVTPRILAAFHAGVGPETRRIGCLQRFLDSRSDPEDPGLSEFRRQRPGMCQARRVAADGLTLFGSAQTVRDRVRWLGEIGVTDVVGIFDFGGASLEESIASMNGWASLVGVGAGAADPGKTGHPGEARVRAAPGPDCAESLAPLASG
jgi:alkanesulfonate monooxygenase SsuD/methylene tetrahydromethanopterin reductase-like flavin-dependent oxidoreductase (luciferase family)